MPEGPIRLEAPANFSPPRLSDLGEGVQVSPTTRTQAATVYWDTPDLRLARWGCTLQCVEDDGWVVELAGVHSGNPRAVESIAVKGAPDRPPAPALDLLRAFVRTTDLQPVGRLRRLRQSVQVGSDNNGRGIKVLSDEVSVLHGRRVAVRYRELVLDVGPEADTVLLHGVIARLRAAGAGGPDPVPEYARVLGPNSMEPPELVLGAPSTDATVGEAVSAVITGSVVRLMRHDPAVRLGDDAESVHQARVATRRLRSDLSTFKRLLLPEPTAALRSELKWIAALLGDVRDADVLVERMTGRLAEIPGPASGQKVLLQRLAERRSAARVLLIEAMGSARYSRLLDALVAAALAPPMRKRAGAPAGRVMPALVAPAWKRLQRAVDRLGQEPADEDLHAVRIAAKQARYAAEAVAPVVGRRAARFAELVAGLQGTLGDFHDTVVARHWLGEVSSGLGAGVAFYAGVLTERERLLGDEAIAGWRAAWKKLDHKKIHRWLDVG